MLKHTDFLRGFMERTGVGSVSAGLLMKAAQNALGDSCFKEIIERFMAELPPKMDAVYDIKTAADKTGVHEYTLKYLIYALSARELCERYAQKSVSEHIYWDSMRDLTYKLIECESMYGVTGVSTGDWHTGFFNMTRFALGRMQYEIRPFRGDFYEKAGVRIETNAPALNIHIPSSGEPFDAETRLASYKKAYEFFRKDFSGEVMPFMCSSWLLYSGHEAFLPVNSNILGFMRDFTIINSRDYETPSDLWRIFYRKADEKPENLPGDTSLMRAYADMLMATGKTGSGYGVFLFDGEKILR